MTQAQTQAPKGWHNQAAEIAGFWKPEAGPIQGTLLKAVRFMNSKRRPTLAYLIRVSAPCKMTVKGINGGLDETEASPGEIVAVFSKGALKRPLSRLQGCEIWLRATGQVKNVPAGEMHVYEVFSKNPNGAPLTIEDSGKSVEDDSGEVDSDDIAF